MKAFRFLLVGPLLAIFIESSAIGAEAVTNRWTKSASGYWEEPFWSLGRLPSAGDTVLFDNEGFKALAVGSVTASNYPASLSMQNLGVYGSNNLLLLNWAGKAVPLNVASNFTLGPGAALSSHSSAIIAQTFNQSGPAMFGDESEASFGSVNIGALAPAELIISNAVISSEQMHVGASNRGTVNQFGGINRVTRSNGEPSQLLVDRTGDYNLNGGVLEADHLELLGSATSTNFTVAGGTFRAGSIGVQGQLLLESGRVEANAISLYFDGLLRQTGGDAVTRSLGVPSHSFTSAGYELRGGVLTSSNAVIGQTMGRGTFEQTSGTHSNRAMAVWGYDRTMLHHFSGRYTLSGGLLTSDLLEIPGGMFYQAGGSNYAQQITIDHTGTYIISNGFLRASNILVVAHGAFFSSFRGIFEHGGGQTIIQNELRIDPLAIFNLRSGNLSAPNIILDTEGSLSLSVPLTNSNSITLRGGKLSPGSNHTHQFGQLALAKGSPAVSGADGATSVLNLPAGAAIARFKPSGGVAWESGTTLVISNWAGSLSGGGAHQVFVGDSSPGLTPAQLNQIRFFRPSGLPQGEYAATILGTGEIIPLDPTGPGPSIAFQQSPEQLRLEWPSGYILQTATNIAGSFSDVATNSPYLADPRVDLQRYFRLRR